MNRNTPGPAGYVGGIWVGLSVLAAPLVVLLYVTPEGATVLLDLLLALGIPVAVLGAGVLHLALRHQARQGIHVFGAAVLGATGAFACVVVLWTGPFVAAVIALWAGFASAAGRAAVSRRA